MAGALKILAIVEDSEAKAILKSMDGFMIELSENSQDARDKLDSGEYGLVFLEKETQSNDDQETFDHIVDNLTQIKCIILAKNATIHESVEAVKRGAFDYLNLPVEKKDISGAIKKAGNTSQEGVESLEADDNDQGAVQQGSNSTKTESADKAVNGFSGLVGNSPQMQKIFKTIKKVSATDSTVLITGESGTGKELVARAVHNNSSRANFPLVIINCGAIPGELLESELFGHEKGAFTGAHKTRVGRFELAEGGTMFLDEIGDMSPSLQVKLLRVLQERTFERVGSAKTITVDIRILAATNKDLPKSIDKNEFREDLYYRLNVIPVHVPPLRDRFLDIPLLIDHFLTRFSERTMEPKKSFSVEAEKTLLTYDWNGNIRELENLMERLSVLVDEEVIEYDDLPDKIKGKESTPGIMAPFSLEDGIDFNTSVEQYQKELILQALNKTDWVKAKAAELLKIKRTTLVEKIKKMKLDEEDPGPNPQH